MTFRPLTPQQRTTYDALRTLGEMIVSPQDARPLRALQRRGLIRYRRQDGARVAVLRKTASQVRATRRARAWALLAYPA